MKKLLWLLMGLLCIAVSACGSEDEPEPTYNWWVLISVNQYRIGSSIEDLYWVKETRHDERYELNKTESYIKEQQSKYEGRKASDGEYLYIFSYQYEKVDYIPAH